MNSGFNEGQIKAYATAFEVGDAIWCNGEWHAVVENEVNGDSRLTAHVDGNIYVINDGQSGNHYAFKVMERSENPYRVTTLQDYELQGGEKLVWLGECIDLTFGEIYVVESDNKHSGGLKVTDDAGDRWLVGSNYFEGLIDWAVIPRYEQVQSIEQKEVKTSDIANILYKRYYDVLQSALHNNIKSALQENNYSLVIELSKMMMEMQVEHEEE